MSYNLVVVGGTAPALTGALEGSGGLVGGNGVYGMRTAAVADQPDQFLMGNGLYGESGASRMGTGSIEFKMKRNGAPAGMEVMLGHDFWWWIGMAAGTNHLQLHYGGGGASELILNGVINVCDNVKHHVEINFVAGLPKIYVDGVLDAAAGAGATQAVGVAGTGVMVGGWLTNGLKFGGQLDELAFSNVARHTANFAAPAGALPDSRANQVAVYHFEGNANDTNTPIIAANDAKIVYSPYNWDVTASRAKTINAGAYFRTIISGSPTQIQLLFDVTADLTPTSQISYRIDGGAWVSTALTASVTVPIPSTDQWTKHTVEVIVKSMTETQNRWNPQSTQVTLTGIYTLPETCVTATVRKRALNVLSYGDSITEAVRALGSTQPNDTDRNDASLGWAYNLRHALGAEVGVVGFGGTGMTVSGSGGVPALPTSYNLLWGGGPARDFTTTPPDVIVINEGTNDSGDITTAYTTTLNNLLAATPSTTIIFCMLPFNGGHATQIQAAIAASNSPARCRYVDTTGWLSTADTSDSTHPFGYVDAEDIAPRLALAIRNGLQQNATYIRVAGVAKQITPVRK